MMVLKRFVKGIFGMLRKLEGWSGEEKPKLYVEPLESRGTQAEEIHSVWDYLQFMENTQAFHLSGVLSFEEWVEMGEIRRRIRDIFGAEYKNERSLYPYLKTLGDIGLIESTNVGGKRKWRKRDLLIKIKKQPEKKDAEAAQETVKERGSEE